MEINIIGVVGDFVFDVEDSDKPRNVLNAADMNSALAEAKEDEEITVNINSVGGSVFEGFGMFNALKAAPQKIVAKINGMAFSIASLIALAADEIQMSEVSMFMIHRASGMAMGNAEEMEKQMAVLKSIDETLVNVYAQKTGIASSEVENLMDKETFFTSEEALSAGFVDEIINRIDAKMAASFNLKEEQMKLKNFWAQVMDSKSPAQVKNEEAENAENPFKKEEEEETEEEAEKRKAEEDEEEKKKKEEESNSVSREEFDSLKSSIGELSSKMDEAIEAASTAAAEKAVNELKTGLKSSNALPITANGSETNDATKGYIDKYAKFRAEMSEIDSNTRPEKK